MTAPHPFVSLGDIGGDAIFHQKMSLSTFSLPKRPRVLELGGELSLGRSLGLEQIPDRDLVSQFQHDAESIGAEADVTDISDFN